MFELIRSGGWVMWPIILCSIAALAITGERLWSLQKKYVTPSNLLAQAQQWLARGELDEARVNLLRESSPLGRILAAGLINRDHERVIIKEAIEDAGRHVAPELERYLRPLGTIAGVSPFLGLLGTVLGMIQMFSGIGSQGVGDPSIVAGGIAQALITTAAGLTVAIPSLMFYRYFRGRVDALLLDMEQEALKLVEILHGEREKD
ncbi:MAG: biopolymer transporter ExbB [Candidatus Muproteobacteria bacterium RIFCSPHIGHO2_01_FULL_65_16]|uniref:Biopolymer transporter ExbB n=1 Tax=Candidatus Muproteobacteria bacterium RIFCSPHIGHO2_01_FULL_65_16 TaxID=1817764 RepID=A0A1F6TFA8_9PROT|nr:MAG: biopolymer transporter ExbB [Candidatus Muproteobacteria bacterium RIFCSPHIGHO2_01_FULL_65_16]